MDVLTLGKFYSIEAIESANARAGRFFFSKDTLRFFQSRIGSRVYRGASGWYFVTSERYGLRYPRHYTVRKANPNGTIDTIGEFGDYDNRRTAHSAAAHFAKGAA